MIDGTLAQARLSRVAKTAAAKDSNIGGWGRHSRTVLPSSLPSLPYCPTAPPLL